MLEHFSWTCLSRRDMIHLFFADWLRGEVFARGQSEDAMTGKVDLYDGEYGNYEADVYQQVRIETYGVDFGQTSWVTTEESTQIPSLLELTGNSSVLEIGCGSGVYALHLAQTTGCSITG